MIRLIVGLGNPGAEYEATRHNAGFWWVDNLAEQLRAPLLPERSYQARVARVNNAPGASGPIWLLEPMTFMNRSGVSVSTLARFFKIAPQEILVVHDELDLQPGQAKLKFGGSAAGHNGLKDIQQMLGSQDYWRLRLGIGHPGVKAEVVNYVLKQPSAEHREAIARATAQSLRALEPLLSGDMDRALALVHAQPQRPKPPRKPPGERPAPGAGPSLGMLHGSLPGEPPVGGASTPPEPPTGGTTDSKETPR